MTSNKNNKTIVLVEGALCVALALVLTQFRFFALPQDGSIDFELLPLFIFAYRRGVKHACLAGAVEGLMNIILGGYVLNPVQALLDYPVAFATTGLAGLRPKILGFILAMTAGISCNILSWVFFFAENAPAGQNVWAYSFFYNISVLGPKYLISGIAAVFLWKALEKQMPVK